MHVFVLVYVCECDGGTTQHPQPPIPPPPPTHPQNHKTTNKPQSGILEAYEQLIASARHYLYLEAPAFVSGLRGDPLVGNRVAEVRACVRAG